MDSLDRSRGGASLRALVVAFFVVVPSLVARPAKTVAAVAPKLSLAEAVAMLDSDQRGEVEGAVRRLRELGKPGDEAFRKAIVGWTKDLGDASPEVSSHAERVLAALAVPAESILVAQLATTGEASPSAPKIRRILDSLAPSRTDLDAAAVLALQRLRSLPVTGEMAEILESVGAEVERLRGGLRRVHALDEQIAKLHAERGHVVRPGFRYRTVIDELRKKQNDLLKDLALPGLEKPRVGQDALSFTLVRGDKTFALLVSEGSLAIGPEGIEDGQNVRTPDWAQFRITDLLPATKNLGHGKSVSNELVVESKALDTSAVVGDRVLKLEKLAELDRKGLLPSVAIPFKLVGSIPPTGELAIRFLHSGFDVDDGGENAERQKVRRALKDVVSDLYAAMVDPEGFTFRDDAFLREAAILYDGGELRLPRFKADEKTRLRLRRPSSTAPARPRRVRISSSTAKDARRALR